MADAQPGSRPTVVEFDDELLSHVVCRIGRQVIERRVDELDRLVLHQLELTNSIEPAKSVKTRDAETTNQPQLLGIHYCFSRGLQEKGAAQPSRVVHSQGQHEVSTTRVSGWVNQSRPGKS